MFLLEIQKCSDMFEFHLRNHLFFGERFVWCFSRLFSGVFILIFPAWLVLSSTFHLSSPKLGMINPSDIFVEES